MLLLTAFASGCTQETHRSEITLPEQEKPPVAEKTITEPAKESIAPKYLNLTAQALYEGPLDTDCPEVQMEQILRMMIAESTVRFEQLPCLVDVDILRNILYDGVWNHYNKIQMKKSEEKNDDKKSI